MAEASNELPTWIEVFPWLASAQLVGENQDSFASSWEGGDPAFYPLTWGEPLAMHFSKDQEFIALVADDALTYNFHWPLGRLFSSVPLEQDLLDFRFGSRAKNILLRHGFRHFTDLAKTTLGELFDLHTLGQGTYREIFGELFRKNIDSYGIPVTDEGLKTSKNFSSPSPLKSENRDPALDELTGAVDVLSKWAASLGSDSLGIVFKGTNDEPLPPSVIAAMQWLSNLSPGQWLGANGKDFPEISDVLSSLLEALDERDRKILTGRVLANEPLTLGELGSVIGVTRERVRQLESKLMGSVRSWLDDPELLQYHSVGLRHKMGPIAPLKLMLESFPALAGSLPGLGLPAWFVLDKLDDTFESDGNWIAQPSLQSVLADFEVRFLEVSTGDGFASVDVVVDSLAAWVSMPKDSVLEWAQSHGYWILEQHIVAPKIQSLQQLAFTYLAIKGVPSSPDAILSAVKSTKSQNSLKNALSVDSRFVRSGRTEWALAEWGAREYSGIRDAITHIIQERGETHVDKIIEELSGRFQVSPKSIVTYANSWPLETVAGNVRLADRPKTSRRSLSDTKNLYSTSDGIKYRLEITSEHLRGSGTALPIAIANHLGLVPGEKFTLDSSEGELVLSWVGLQPAMGSIRKFLVKDAITVGEQVLISMTKDSVRVSRVFMHADLTPNQKVSSMLGLPIETDVSASEVGKALGLSSQSTWASVIPLLSERGESDVLEEIHALQDDSEAFDYLIGTSANSKFRILGITEAN